MKVEVFREESVKLKGNGAIGEGAGDRLGGVLLGEGGDNFCFFFFR